MTGNGQAGDGMARIHEGLGEETDARLARELAVIREAYAQLAARDGTAERRAWHWQLGAMGFAGLASFALLGLMGFAWLAYHRAQAVVVQTQQVEEGRIVNLGGPVSVLDYAPQQGHWMDMLQQWVEKRRWRSGDPSTTRRDWAWVYAHTCGKALTFLGQEEKLEKPFEPTATQVKVAVESLTQSPAPLNWNVHWAEQTLDPMLGPKHQSYTGTFVVGRAQPTTPRTLALNRLWLCVSAYNIQPRQVP